MKSYQPLQEEAKNQGALDAKLISASDIVFDSRSFLKCRYGCDRWGKFWTCQPHVGITIEQFQETLKKYSQALVIKCAEPKLAQEITVAIEKKAMFEYDAPFAFGLALCVQCEECAYPEPCRFPYLARPAMDGLGVDIGRTVEKIGFTVEFDPDGQLLPAWYTMVLLD